MLELRAVIAADKMEIILDHAFSALAPGPRSSCG